jgi:hypothetical protein
MNTNTKKIIKWKNLEIHLLEPVDYRKLDKSASNINAYDDKGNLIWKAEPPKSYKDEYYDMQIDTVENCLMADTGSSLRHIINLENGKVIRYFLVK